MEYRTLDITLISAKDLKYVNHFTKMDVYAVAYIAGGNPAEKQKTHVDKDGNTHPKWKFPMKFTVEESAAQQNRLTLVVKLVSDRALGDKDIGEVNVPIKEIIGDDKNDSVKEVKYPVITPSGKAVGELKFSYKFREKISVAGKQMKATSDEPVTAYPAPPTAAGPSSGYPPPPGGPGYPQPGYPHGGMPQQGYGYPPQQAYGGYQPPPPQGYGYPPQQGYGYPPQQGIGYQQPPKKNKMGGGLGLGLGAGLLGGALGGMLIGDMIADDAAYDAGYDAGFDDGGDF